MPAPFHLPLLLLLLLGLSWCPPCSVLVFVGASLPDVVLRVAPTPLSESNVLTVTDDHDPLELLVKRASFGSKAHYLKGTLVRSPDNDPYLCERFYATMGVDPTSGEVSVITMPPHPQPDGNESTILLVPRGECSFERKAYAAKAFYGARGIMIYDRLGARYRWNSTTNRVIFPFAQYDYECGNGHQFLENLPLDPPAYNSTLFDPFMGMEISTTTDAMRDYVSPRTTRDDGSSDGDGDGDGGGGGGASTSAALDEVDEVDEDYSSSYYPLKACNLTGTTHHACESNLCLVTSHVQNSTSYPVCCAWDVPMIMPPSDDAADLDTDDVLAVFLTIRQSEAILGSDILSSGSEVTIRTRGSTSVFNGTYVLMWLWGTLVMAVAARYAAGEYRSFGAKLTATKAAEEAANRVSKSGSKGGSGKRDRSRRSSTGGRDSSNKSIASGGRDRSDRSNRSGASGTGNRNRNGNGNRSRRSGTGGSGKDNATTAIPKSSMSSYSSRSSSSKKAKASEERTLLGDLQTDIDIDIESGEFQDSGGFEDEIVFQMKSDKPPVNGGGEPVWSLRSIPPRQPKKRPSIPRDRTPSAGRSGSVAGVGAGAGAGAGSGKLSASEASFVPPRDPKAVESFEMTHWHVLIFIVMCSLTLILLFFFRIYNFFFILFGIGCGGAVAKLIFDPILAKLVPRLGKGWVDELQKPVVCGMDGFGITSKMLAYTWAALWIWFGFTHYLPQQYAFFWVTLDIFGAVVCTLSATSLKLNSIKIAMLLLTAIFFYDVFFVFISPFLTGGQSIMLNVATGSGNPIAHDYCYKYPKEPGCTGVSFLPMLFIFPKFNDYASGTVILGLGDIVLPGFLIAFSSRYDEASRLIGAHMTQPGIPVPTKWYQGYFFPMMIAYSVGLFLAISAVLIMQQGQPALLYICPCCMITILLLGRKNLKDLWNGAKVFRLADRFIQKTERDWGKARMKRFAEQCMNQNSSGSGAASRWGSDHGSDSNLDPTEFPSEELTQSEELALVTAPPPPPDPEPRDVCFRNNEHPGTRSFRKAVKDVATDYGQEEEFKPDIYKKIKKKLKGRRFFKKRDDAWEEATKKDCVKEIGLAYDHERGKMSTILQDIDVPADPDIPLL